MKTITHCLLLLLLFVYTTESVNPFRSIFQRRALYYRITKAVQQKDHSVWKVPQYDQEEIIVDDWSIPRTAFTIHQELTPSS